MYRVFFKNMLVLSAVTIQFGRLFHVLTTLLVKQQLHKSYLNRTFCNLISLCLVLNVHALFMNGTTSASYFPDNILYVPIRGGDLGGQGDRPLQIIRWRGQRCFYPPQYSENVIANCHSKRE